MGPTEPLGLFLTELLSVAPGRSFRAVCCRIRAAVLKTERCKTSEADSTNIFEEGTSRRVLFHLAVRGAADVRDLCLPLVFTVTDGPKGLQLLRPLLDVVSCCSHAPRSLQITLLNICGLVWFKHMLRRDAARRSNSEVSFMVLLRLNDVHSGGGSKSGSSRELSGG